MSEPNALQQAFGHLKAGKLAQAEEVCRGVLEADPGEPDALYLLGAVALQAGKAQRAIELIGKAIQRNPQKDVYYVHLAECYTSLGRPDHAVSFSEQALRLNPLCPEAHCAIGSAFLAQGLRAEAVSRFDRALELKPGFAQAHYNRGNALFEMGKIDEAIAAYRRSLAAAPTFSAAQYNLGNALALRGENFEAAEAFKEAAKLSPRSSVAYFNLGNTRRKLGDVEAARNAFLKALDLDPRMAAAHRHLGTLAKLQGQMTEADARFRRALHLDPKDAEAQSELAHLYLLSGHASEAIAAYRRSLKIDPNFAWAYMGLSSALAKAEDIDAAREATRKAIGLRRRFEWPFHGREPIGRIVSLKGIEDGYFELGNGDELTIQGGLNNADTHFDKTKFRQSSFYVDELDRGAEPAELPDCEVIFNCISDPEAMPRSLRAARRIAEAASVPVVNPPDAVAQTQRHTNYAAFKDLEGVAVPKLLHLTAAPRQRNELLTLLEQGGLDFPVLLRCAGTHNGDSLEKVETVEQALEYFALNSAEAYYVTEFLDLADARGVHAKYRVRVVDGALYPDHAFFGEAWRIQSFKDVRDYMLANSWAVEKAKRFFDDPAKAIGGDAWAGLDAVRSRLPLDYFGIDFSLRPDGKPVVFEANATMRLVHPELGDLDELHDIRVASIEAIRLALQGLMEKRVRRQ